MFERADLDAAIFYLPLIVIPAARIEVVSRAILVQTINEIQVYPISSQALKSTHPLIWLSRRRTRHSVHDYLIPHGCISIIDYEGRPMTSKLGPA